MLCLWSTWNQQVAGPLTIHGANALGRFGGSEIVYHVGADYFSTNNRLSTQHFLGNNLIYHSELSELCCCIVFRFCPLKKRLVCLNPHGEVDEAAPAPVSQATPATSSRHGAGGPGKVAKLIQSCLERIASIIQILHFCVKKVSK